MGVNAIAAKTNKNYFMYGLIGMWRTFEFKKYFRMMKITLKLYYEEV